MPHFGFRDRLPTNFGSENLRERAVFFDDLLNDAPAEDTWNLLNNSGVSNGIVETVPGGVYSLGIGNLGTGQGVGLYTARNFDPSKQMNYGARIMFGESWESAVGYSTDQLGMFVGLHSLDSNYGSLFALTGKANLGWGVGFIRDTTTVAETDSSFLQVGYWYTDGGTTTTVAENFEFSAGFQNDTFYEFGMTFSPHGVVRFTVDDEQVAEMKPVIRSGQMYGPMIAHYNANSDGSTYPTPVAVDWAYCSQDRVDRKPFA